MAALLSLNIANSAPFINLGRSTTPSGLDFPDPLQFLDRTAYRRRDGIDTGKMLSARIPWPLKSSRGSHGGLSLKRRSYTRCTVPDCRPIIWWWWHSIFQRGIQQRASGICAWNALWFIPSFHHSGSSSSLDSIRLHIIQFPFHGWPCILLHI
jgi:hypothetical protein